MSLLSLFALQACGGGGFLSTGGSGSSSGTVGKGPLEGAVAFFDDNDNGELDDGEAYAFTDADGNYTIDAANTQGSPIVAITSSAKSNIAGLSINAVDNSTGASAGDIVLKAPAGASMVSPLSTVIESGAVSEAALAEALGIPAGVDLLTFDAFADDADATAALAFEKAAVKVMTTVETVAGAVEGEFASSAAAMEAAFSSLGSAVASDADFDIDGQRNGLDQLFTEMGSKIADAGGDANALTAVETSTKNALATVNTAVEALTSFTNAADVAVLSTARGLSEQAKQGSAAMDAFESTFNAKVTAVQNNQAPNDITISSFDFQTLGSDTNTDPDDDRYSLSFDVTGVDPDSDATAVTLSGADSNLADLSSSTVTFSNAISETEDSVTTYTISEKDAFELSLIASETLT